MGSIMGLVLRKLHRDYSGQRSTSCYTEMESY